LTARRKKTTLLTSLVLVFPLLLFYEVGVLFTDVMNGADFLTQTLFHLLGFNGYLVTQGVLVLAYVGLLLFLRRRQEFDLRMFVPVLLESGVYALTMGTLIVFFMVDLLGIDPRLGAGGGALQGAGILDRMVMAVGAGIFEELVFRLLLLTALTALGERALGLRRWVAVLLAFVVSSLAFSAAHHLGPLGEPLRLGVFVYRFMAGMFFAALYQFRSFGIAVYTHTLYDVYVLLIR
jgi:membrane protease YdiL (CAAX protease family)